MKKLQRFASICMDNDGVRIVWRQGYHYQMHGQSIYIADSTQKWDMRPEFGERWGAYDEDSGALLATAPTLDRCADRCERFIRRYQKLFTSDTYIALCHVFMALIKEDEDDD